ncbi:LacI family DNA-binding transcriptional regulator [Actinophytocola algeriensis]|uniref:LacI family transcriptional regulator n=1 Tax=Actinophytocola algeriensis TaxID=1768010 RepID=A0A7W7Q1T6_9PSEU|nr:LacI family DNA-binding transcriptional regulator [Actinophytocola algeriensis]MBB4905462.1 LacI family transcriptional regulator [Actinophytocola algeriensis]MBE1472853.1 LacI family transcriptional regulator [Actinophytocola algeriensis]
MVRVTLKDIANEAGVSMMTVSNVINGNRARVSPETIERVRRIVAERGYVPSASARSLAARSSRLIGLLVPAADEDSLTLSPHTGAILGQIERALRKRGYHLLLRGIAHPDEVGEALQSWSLDGAVLLGFLDEEVDALDVTVPVLAVDSYSRNRLATGVRSDDFEGGRIAAAHLLGLGHREILFAGPSFSDVGVVHQRFEGFRQAFADRGLSWSDSLIATVNTTHASGRELGLRLRADFPSATAVFATADILAIGVMAGLVETGVPVPGVVSVVGFDDLDLSAIVTPKLTTVAQDIPTKAAMAVDLLLAAVEKRDRPAEPVTLDVHLVERESTAPR